MDGSGKNVVEWFVINDSTDCDGIVKLGVLIAPPPNRNVAALITAMAPLWMPTPPHIAGPSVGVVASPVTLIGTGTSVVVAVDVSS